MGRAFRLLLFFATVCIVAAGRRKKGTPPPPPPGPLAELKADLTTLALAVKDKVVSAGVAPLALAKETVLSAVAVAKAVARGCADPKASLSAAMASLQTLHDNAEHWIETFPATTETVLDDLARDVIHSVSTLLGVSRPLVAALALGVLAALGALAASFYPALATAAKRAFAPLRAATALFLLMYGEHVYLLVQAAAAFGAIGWPVVVHGAGEIAEMVKKVEGELVTELSKCKAAIGKFAGALASCDLGKLGGAARDLGKESVGLPLALAASIKPETIVAIMSGVLAAVLSSLATVSSDAAARLTVALALAQGLGERVIAATAAPLKLVEAAADVAKPGAGAAVGGYAKQAIKGASIMAALAFVDANGALVKRLQPALLGAGLVLGLAGSNSAALEYGLAAVACYFQTKSAGAPLPANLAASLHWLLRGEAYLYGLSQQTAGA